MKKKAFLNYKGKTKEIVVPDSIFYIYKLNDYLAGTFDGRDEELEKLFDDSYSYLVHFFVNQAFEEWGLHLEHEAFLTPEGEFEIHCTFC